MNLEIELENELEINIFFTKLYANPQIYAISSAVTLDGFNGKNPAAGSDLKVMAGKK
jgi:hypothetical protein